MPGKLKEGIPALCNFQAVKFYHFPVQPDTSLVLTSDPWSFLYAYLSKNFDKSRGKNSKCLERAIYYSELAAD